MTATHRHRTQFDAQLLLESVSYATSVLRNHGRQQVVLPDGSVVTALAWGGEKPVLRIWRDCQLLVEHPLLGLPSAPCLLMDRSGQASLWISADDVVLLVKELGKAPAPVKGLTGAVEDAALDSKGRVVLM